MALESLNNSIIDVTNLLSRLNITKTKYCLKIRDRRFSTRIGLSPVIATVILAGVVMTIGGAIWSYSLGAASVTADVYVNDTLDMLCEMQERFDVEHVYYNALTDELQVWIHNYGEVEVTADIYVTLNSSICKSSANHKIVAGNITRVDIDFSSNPIPSQELVAIKIYSRRQNIAYHTYYVP